MKRQKGADLSVDLLAGAPWLCKHSRGYGSCDQQQRHSGRRLRPGIKCLGM